MGFQNHSKAKAWFLISSPLQALFCKYTIFLCTSLSRFCTFYYIQAFAHTVPFVGNFYSLLLYLLKFYLFLKFHLMYNFLCEDFPVAPELKAPPSLHPYWTLYCNISKLQHEREKKKLFLSHCNSRSLCYSSLAFQIQGATHIVGGNVINIHRGRFIH